MGEILKILVPYRNREKQLKTFTDALYQFLSLKIKHDFKIYIVEQDDDNQFNKGCLFNVGFLETRGDSNDYYCLHDIDILPKNSNADYSKPPTNTICHPYGYLHCLGGKVLLNTDTFEKLNGFSTNYWGWGFEDTDFMLRAKQNNVKISRNNFSKRNESDNYYELDNGNFDVHMKYSRINSKVNELLFYYSVIHPDLISKEGLSTTDYSLKNIQENKKYTLIKCQIDNPNKNIAYSNLLEKYLRFVNIADSKNICK